MRKSNLICRYCAAPVEADAGVCHCCGVAYPTSEFRAVLLSPLAVAVYVSRYWPSSRSGAGRTFKNLRGASTEFWAHYPCPRCLLLGVKRTFLQLTSMPIVDSKWEPRPAQSCRARQNGESFETSCGCASILFISGPRLSGIPHLMKNIERKEGHPLLLVRTQSFVQRLPRISEFLEVG